MLAINKPYLYFRIFRYFNICGRFPKIECSTAAKVEGLIISRKCDLNMTCVQTKIIFHIKIVMYLTFTEENFLHNHFLCKRISEGITEKFVNYFLDFILTHP